MQKIILISGFGGSGKSTCAQLLWEKLEQAAIVEADHLFRIKPFELHTEEGRKQIGRVKLKNSLAVANTFMEEGIKNIIIEGLVWSQEELDAVATLAKEQMCDVYCFWLKTSKEVRYKRVLSRNRDDADSQEFLDLVEKQIVDPTPLLLTNGRYHEIETDELTAELVTDEILKKMKVGSSA